MRQSVQAAQLAWSVSPDLSNLISAVPAPTGGVTVKFRDPQGVFSDLGADEVELWISGAGLNLVRPYQSAIDITLNTQTAPTLRGSQD